MQKVILKLDYGYDCVMDWIQQKKSIKTELKVKKSSR